MTVLDRRRGSSVCLIDWWGRGVFINASLIKSSIEALGVKTCEAK